jgi:hypothetical protein
LLACEWYEYARESRAAIKEITAARKRIKQRKGKGGHTKFRSLILIYLAITKGFPNVPWINLSVKDRAIFLKMVTGLPNTVRYLQTGNNPPLLFSKNEPGTMTLDGWRKQCRERLPSIPISDPITSGFFAVNMKYMKYGRIFLIEEFAKWLTHFEGKAMSETPPIENELVARKKLPGRKSIYDTLNALAVMRLRYHCASFSEAKKRMGELTKRNPEAMFYTYRNSTNRACNLALRRFQQLYGWLDSEKPIHFTEGWRGGLRNHFLFLSPAQ